LQQMLIATYSKYGAQTILRRGIKTYTGEELVQELENETEFGLSLYTSIISLTIDLLARDKIHLP